VPRKGASRGAVSLGPEKRHRRHLREPRAKGAGEPRAQADHLIYPLRSESWPKRVYASRAQTRGACVRRGSDPFLAAAPRPRHARPWSAPGCRSGLSPPSQRLSLSPAIAGRSACCSGCVTGAVVDPERQGVAGRSPSRRLLPSSSSVGRAPRSPPQPAVGPRIMIARGSDIADPR